MIRHPSRRSLQSWLAGDHDAKVDAHVADCERCATNLENLDEPQPDGSIGRALSVVLAPPSDLTTRLEGRVADRLDSRQVVGYVADLFGAAIDTSKLLLTDDGGGRANLNRGDQ